MRFRAILLTMPASLALAVGIVAAGLAASVAPARASINDDPAEQRVYPHLGAIPACGDAAVISEILGSFASREATYWGGRLAISGIDRVRQTAMRPWGRNFIPRRFCTARAHVSDGRIRRVNYLVRETHGVFGNSWEVTWCVTGLDRHRTYAPRCKQATPW